MALPRRAEYALAAAESALAAAGDDKNDISAISHYASNCDAMIVDNFFRGLASQRNIGVPQRFDVKLFSARTLPRFIAYLDNLVHNIPLDHRKAVKAVVPHVSQLLILKTEMAEA